VSRRTAAIRTAVGIALAVPAVAVLGACSADRVMVPADASGQRTNPILVGTGTGSDPAPATPTDTIALRAVDKDDGTPLTTNVILENNTIVVEPVAGGAEVDADVNLATARATTRIDANTPRSAPLTCRFGVLTQTVDDRVQVDHQPVWMCFQVGVPIATTFNGPEVPTNTVTFVDATTGEWLFTNEDPA
jgi:hypothetical protein